MATLGNSFIDLIDIYKMQDGQGQFNPIIEMLMEMNPILEDAIAVGKIPPNQLGPQQPILVGQTDQQAR